MRRTGQTVRIDQYMIDVLMRDLVGHDRHPAAYLVYLWLYGQAAPSKWRAVPASVRFLADATGLSKSAVQNALKLLRRRQLIKSENKDGARTMRKHRVLRSWSGRKAP